MIDTLDVLRALEESDHDDGKEAWKRIGAKTIKVYYTETDGDIWVRGVSATRRKLRA